MNRIRQYRPAFFSGFENATAEFETVEQLLAIPFVAGFTEPVEWPFHRFSLSQNRLMAEYDQGRHWWVVGFIDRPAEVDLPAWVPVEDIEVPAAIGIPLGPIMAGVIDIGSYLTLDAEVVGLSRRTG